MFFRHVLNEQFVRLANKLLKRDHMFSLFKKDPIKKLDKEYSALLERALAAQRKGDIRSYSDLTSQAEVVAQEIDRIKAH